jgi:hypothetical protein
LQNDKTMHYIVTALHMLFRTYQHEIIVKL